MENPLGTFTFVGYRPLATKYEFEILQKQPFTNDNYDLYIFNCFNTSYFYLKKQRKIYKKNSNSNYYPGSVIDFPVTFTETEENAKQIGISPLWHNLDWIHPKINSQIIFICKNYIFQARVKNVTGFDMACIDMKNITPEGFYEKLLDFVEKLLSD